MKSETDLKTLGVLKKSKTTYGNKKPYNVLPYVASTKSIYSNPLKYYESQVFAKEVVPKLQAQNQFSFLLALSKGIDQEANDSGAASPTKDELLSFEKDKIAVDDMLLDKNNLGSDTLYESLFPESVDQILSYSESETTKENEKQQDNKSKHSEILNTTIKDSLIDKDYPVESLLEDAVIQPSRFFVCFPCNI